MRKGEFLNLTLTGDNESKVGGDEETAMKLINDFTWMEE